MESLTTRNAVKRLLHELKGIREAESDDFTVSPLENNLFQWHFTLRGPADSPYAEGFYHGKLLFPANYPFAPPDIYFLTESGRFQVNTKICISITSFHPENWSPSFTVPTVLRALRLYMASPGHGSVGSLDYPEETVRQLAVESRAFRCPQCGEVRGRLEKPRSHVDCPTEERLAGPPEDSAQPGQTGYQAQPGQTGEKLAQEGRDPKLLHTLDQCIAYGKLLLLALTVVRLVLFCVDCGGG